jgi:hypothetical protein
MTPKRHMNTQKRFAKETGSRTFTAPPGTDSLPLAERLYIYLDVFESGCTSTQPPIGNGNAEDCPECVRSFVDAVKAAVDEAIAADPLAAVSNMATWASEHASEAQALRSKGQR